MQCGCLPGICHFIHLIWGLMILQSFVLSSAMTLTFICYFLLSAILIFPSLKLTESKDTNPKFVVMGQDGNLSENGVIALCVFVNGELALGFLELSLSFYGCPNISDRFTFHFICIQIFKIDFPLILYL